MKNLDPSAPSITQMDVKYGTSLQKDAQRKEYVFIAGTKELLRSGPLNLLLLCTPFAIISYFSNWPQPITFTLSLLSIAPFAERLGYVTEQLAMHTNETIGGLLNATFGNATELIISLSALNQGLYRVIQLSLLGSILSNLLLVMGCAFLAGGTRFKTQRFGTISGQINSSLLMLSCMGLLFPAVLTISSEENIKDELMYSRITSLVLIVMYGCYLFFQLKTHRDAYEGGDEEGADSKSIKEARTIQMPSRSSVDVEEARSPVLAGLMSGSELNDRAEDPSSGGGLGEGEDEGEGAEDEDEDVLGFNYSIVWLAIITIFISFLSNALVECIDETAQKVSGFFLSAIVLPIVGNAAEHASAVIFAMRGKLDLSLGVAVGSSTQIALMVLPLLVIFGWFLDKPMSLNFHPFETCSLVLSVVIATFAIASGQSNWLLGAILVGGYVIIATGFALHNNEPLE